MRKALVLVVLCGLLAAFVPPVSANICAFDPVPAASLLFPYVVYDYNNPSAGMNTILYITNTSPNAQIVKIEIWSDYSMPVIGFNVVLSGYDMQGLSMRDILLHGQLPITGTAGPWIVDGPAPHDDGPVSGADASWVDGALVDAESSFALYARCAPTSPAYPGQHVTPLSSTQLDDIMFYLTAAQVANNLHDDCMGNTYGLPEPSWWELRDESQPTWFYVTADVVQNCTNLFSDEPLYWSLLGRYDNVLIGNVIWVDDLDMHFSAGNAVHIEADVQIGSVATLDSLGNPITFYYRHSIRNLVMSDFREPLPTAWALPYFTNAYMTSYIRAWKGSTFYTTVRDISIPGGFVGSFLSYDCWPYTYYAWDEDEGVVTAVPRSPSPWPGPNLLPLETQEVPVTELNLAGSSGWMLFIWPASNYHNLPAAPVPPDYYQTWMGVRHEVIQTGAIMTLDGAVAGNFNCYSDQALPDLGIDYDYVTVTGYTTSPVIP
jgi:hypothetical protein